MEHLRKKVNFFQMVKALAVFAGTIIGVGIFGLPYLAQQTGFLIIFVYFVVIAFLAIIIHYMLGEVSRDTGRIARVPGYAEEYLGSWAKKLAFIISSLGLTGALLAYLIIGGEFLFLLFSPWIGGTVLIYVLVYFILGAFLIYRGTGAIACFQMIIQAVFLVILVFFFIKGVPHFDLQNILKINPGKTMLPYGAIIFSLWGVALVPEIKEMVERKRKRLLQVISWGTIIAAFCYLFFIFTILSVSGSNTTPDAILGFGQKVGHWVIYPGFLFGLITTFTSFITLGLTLKKIFNYDLKLSENFAWTLTCFLPLTLYLLGLKNFINVIGLTGAIFLGLEGIMVVYIYRSFLRKRFQRQAGWYTHLIPIILIIGMILQIISFVKGF